MRMSNDAAHGAGGNVLYAIDGSANSTVSGRNVWAYVSASPSGSGLAANSWTYLNVQARAGPAFNNAAPDPTTAGHVGFVDGGGFTGLCTDYGNSVAILSLNEFFIPPVPPSNQPAWINESTRSNSMSDAVHGMHLVSCGFATASGVFRNSPRAVSGDVSVSISNALQAVMSMSVSVDWQVGDYVPAVQH